MALWKQLAFSLTLVAIVALAWANLHPDANGVLGRYGLEWLSVASSARESEADGRRDGRQGRSGGIGRSEALVLVEPVGEGVVNDRLTAIGTGQAVRTVAVRPLVAGQVETLPVTSGVHVEAGDVILQLDATAETLAVERARLALETARDKAGRLESLLKRRATTAVDAELARSELSTAEVALKQAEFDLSRRTLTAPIAGSLGILAVNEGDYVTTSTDITSIDDRSEILIEFHVPERFASRMTVGAPISATAVAQPGETFEGMLTAVDNRVDEASRTLRVRARIPNLDGRLRAGMSFEVAMSFDGDTYPAVDPLAVQWDSSGPYVWVIDEGTAARRNVAIIQRNPESVLVKADIGAGDSVVTEGVQSLRPGGAVRIADRPGSRSDTASDGEDPAERGTGS